jgi:5'-nucleotidase
MQRRTRNRTFAVLVAAGMVLAACGSSATSSTTTSPEAQRTLTVMVTNDDGVGAPGINAVVQGLRSLPHTRVTVVAPLTNQSGTGGKTTPASAGSLVATPARTASGYPATAVHGYPADTVIWAVRDHGLSFRPDLVVSGINFGQNIGPLAALSGTVGAARQAISLGIPALAASQGVDNGSGPAFTQAVPIVESWVTRHRAELIARSYGSKPLQANLNVPTCAGGAVRGPVTTDMAASGDAGATTTVDCTSTSTSYSNDLEAFEIGYSTLTPLYPPAG